MHEDARVRHDNDAVAGEADAQPQVERRVDVRQAGVETFDVVPHGAAHEHAGLADGEHVELIAWP
jgi:hypothetical protein